MPNRLLAYTRDLPENANTDAQNLALKTALSLSASELRVRRDKAQECVTKAKGMLCENEPVQAAKEYHVKSAVPNDASKSDVEAVQHIFGFMKARMFLSDSTAISILLENCSYSLLVERQRQLMSDNSDHPDYGVGARYLLGESSAFCQGLILIIFALFKSSMALRGATEELIVSLGTAGYSCLIRQMQWISSDVDRDRLGKEMLKICGDSVDINLRTLYAALQRYPSSWNTLSENVACPLDEIKGIFDNFLQLAKRFEWVGVIHIMDVFSSILGYREVTADWAAGDTILERAMFLRDGTTIGRMLCNEVYVCIYCGKAALDEAGDALVSNCSFCRLATYCSRDCQTAHWKSQHKRECSRAIKGKK